MARTYYDVVLGSKRQLTIPAELYRELSLKEGDHLRLVVKGQSVQMEPMVSVPRRLVSERLLQEMEARRGGRADDLTLAEFRMGRRMQERSTAADLARRRSRGRTELPSAETVK